MTGRGTARCLQAALAMVLACSASEAGELRAAAELGVGHTNNLARNSTNPVSASIASLGVDVTASEDSARTKAQLLASVAYTDYAGANFDSQLLGNINGTAEIALLQERLSWTFDETYGQVRRDLFSAPSPLNSESINYFSTGPDLQLRPGGSSQILFSGRYSRVDYEKSAFDSDRLLGGVSIGRSFSDAGKWMLNVRSEKTKFADRTVAQDFDTRRGFLSYELRGARTTWTAYAGYNRVDRAGASDDGALLRLDLTRKIGQIVTLSVTAGRELTDAAGALRLDAGAAVGRGNYETMAATAEPFNRTYGSFGVTAQGRRTRIALSVMLTGDKYVERFQLDRRRDSVDLNVTRSLTSSLMLGAGLSHARDDFQRVLGDGTEQRANAGLTWQASRLLSFSVSGERFRRTSEIETDANETRAWLRIRYGSAAAGMR